MTVLETSTAPDTVLDFIDESVRALQDTGLEPRFILLGPEAYTYLREAIAARYGRSAGTFEQYQYLTLVVDPFRGDSVCVAPTPREVAEGVRAERR
ncbi:MAG: hypothetical protein HKN04_13340 [Rhodothermaceae bacterium]|nr:hypothetical protein [Rhodothermaceae bacterium]